MVVLTLIWSETGGAESIGDGGEIWEEAERFGKEELSPASDYFFLIFGFGSAYFGAFSVPSDEPSLLMNIKYMTIFSKHFVFLFILVGLS